VGSFGRDRPLDDLRPDDFERLRATIAKVWGPIRLGNEIQRVRSVFKFGFEEGLLTVPVRYGASFKKPSAKTLRLARAANGARMFEARELQSILKAAGMPMKAFVLLGLNCGFGASDIAKVPLSAFDLEGGWIDYPRPKTGIPRRCPLWPETVAAVREAVESRPSPRDAPDSNLAFLTAYGRRLVRDYDGAAYDAIAESFAAMLSNLGLKRKALNFYALRHTFRTVADETGDQTAANFIMGHQDPTMAAVYRERIADNRLRRVVDYVHAWAFGPRVEQSDNLDIGG
jgi:integrase